MAEELRIMRLGASHKDQLAERKRAEQAIGGKVVVTDGAMWVGVEGSQLVCLMHRDANVPLVAVQRSDQTDSTRFECPEHPEYVRIYFTPFDSVQ